jgi:periplasmic protein TonB
VALRHIGYFGSVAFHVGLAAYLSQLPAQPPPREDTVITVHEVPAPRAAHVQPPEPAPEPPKASAVPAPAPRPAPAPKPAAARPTPAPAQPAPAPAAAPATAPSEAPADFGTMMGNGSGPGLALPAAPKERPPERAARPDPPARPKLLEKPAPDDEGGCTEDKVKPKPIKVLQPAFTQDAQEARIEGKVRVEVTISATGEVTGVRVLEGLGHGLDEAALAAARGSTFTPANRCGKAIATTFVIGISL